MADACAPAIESMSVKPSVSGVVRKKKRKVGVLVLKKSKTHAVVCITHL
jgi:hypothetical protein